MLRDWIMRLFEGVVETFRYRHAPAQRAAVKIDADGRERPIDRCCRSLIR